MIEHIKGVIRFEGPMSTESVSALLNQLDANLKEYKQILLYFTCNGGSITDSRILIDYLNRYHEYIELVGTWTLASCGFDVMLFFKGVKRIISPVYGVVHLGTNSFDLLSEMRTNSFDTFNREDLKRENVAYLEKIKLVLTSNEYARVKNGEDVFLDCVRLREILKC